MTNQPHVLLLPLDERPVCATLPAQVAAVAGMTVTVPPTHLLPRIKAASDPDALGDWLGQSFSSADAAVVSVEGLTSGGLVPSRIETASIETLLSRLAPLRSIVRAAATGDRTVSAFAIVPRTPDSADTFEEPDYWDPHGPVLHELSVALGSPTTRKEASSLRAHLPRAVTDDWARRRLTRHLLAGACLPLATEPGMGAFVVGIDDAAATSTSLDDAAEIERWIRVLDSPSAFVHHGADEIGTVLLASTIAHLTALSATEARIAVLAADPDGLTEVPPYEGSPVAETANRQILAAGGAPVEGAEFDAVLVIHTPDGNGDWATRPAQDTDEASARATADVVAAVTRSYPGVPVAVADVAQPNGADPRLVFALDRHGLFDALTGFAGWNTASNTIGTAVSILVAALAGKRRGSYSDDARRRLLAARVAEDFGWMSVARQQIRAHLGSDPSRHDWVDPAGPIPEMALAQIRAALSALRAAAQWDLGERLSFPWHRTFEVDITVEDA